MVYRNRDEKRIDIFIENGYSVVIVWSSDDYIKRVSQIERILDEKRIQTSS